MHFILLIITIIIIAIILMLTLIRHIDRYELELVLYIYFFFFSAILSTRNKVFQSNPNSHQRCSIKKVFLKISQCSLENTYVGVSS